MGEPSHKREMQALVDRVYAKYQPLADGEVATYIPELGRASPDGLAFAL